VQKTPKKIGLSQARAIWLRCQGLSSPITAVNGPKAVLEVVKRLGYVQIDTIHVIQRAHHHILHSRIKDYRPQDLNHCQSFDRTIFEHWTHALSYIPLEDFRFFRPQMLERWKAPGDWFRSISKESMTKVLRWIEKEGPLTIRDFTEEPRVVKEHLWASRKPSQKILQLAFLSGQLAVSARHGMVKEYEITNRHFRWNQPPAPASPGEIGEYVLRRGLRAQGLVSLSSLTFLRPKQKLIVRMAIDHFQEKGEIEKVVVNGLEGEEFWVKPEELSGFKQSPQERVHILSPFDPLVIQRKRLEQFFSLEYRMEAYLPKEKRKFGYFALPVLIGDRFAALIDLKADRQKKNLLIQQWTWLKGAKTKANKNRIEEELERFERFQFNE
jgi:uncharacterized protein